MKNNKVEIICILSIALACLIFMAIFLYGGLKTIERRENKASRVSKVIFNPIVI